MSILKFEYEGVGSIDIDASQAYKTLTEKKGPGAEFTGWVDLPAQITEEEISAIEAAAARIRANGKILVVCGVGGSYLGAAAAIDFLKGAFYNLKAESTGDVKIFFAGNTYSPSCLGDIIRLIGDDDFSVNVISKSGTTLETAVSFRIFKTILEERYGEAGAAERIFVTTSKDTGLLKPLADKNGYETFFIPDSIGGRYSVLTAVGLLPVAAAGCDIRALIQGAKDMREEVLGAGALSGCSCTYAAIRQQLYKNGKKIEIFGTYEPDLRNIGEWLKQLFGESEGKDGLGLFPASLTLTADLHSMGQMVQDGERSIFETIINVGDFDRSLTIPVSEEDFDKLGYIEGMPVGMMNVYAMRGTAKAHLSSDVPQIRITVPDRSEHSLGALFYFFEFACGVSAYIEGVNPFNQPGVEAYKKEIKVLLADRG